MSDNTFQYPQYTTDRRKRTRSRAGYSERRQHDRFNVDYKITIRLGGIHEGEVVHGHAWDVSDGGMRMSVDEWPEDAKRCEVEFEIPDGQVPEEFLHGKMKVRAKVLTQLPDGSYSVQFISTMSDRLSGSVWPTLITIASICTVFALIGYFLFINDDIQFFWWNVPVTLYSITVALYLVTRFVLSGLYRPPKPIPDEEVPKVSMIFPAFNEGEGVREAIYFAMEMAYPLENTEIIVVNDGSTDNTLDVLHRVKEEYEELVIVDLKQNGGLANAMREGVKVATGDIIIFSDSDCHIEPYAVRYIVEGFTDPTVAAIGGDCDVENKWTNSLTKMQSVSYYFNFRVMKKSEGVFSSLTCLSGPLAAYRRTRLLEVIDRWADHKIFGKTTGFGDDRSLTNYLLGNNKILYDSRAKTRTIVPEEMGVYLKQQMRWNRSWVRGSMHAFTFMWKKQPFMSISYYLSVILPVLGPLIVLRALVYQPLVYGQSPVPFVLGVLTMSTLISAAYLMMRKSRLWLYGIPYAIFYMTVLIWQLPYSLLTFWVTKWATRGDDDDDDDLVDFDDDDVDEE